MSFVAKLQSSRNELVWLVKAGHDDKPCWYYLQLEKSKVELFKARLKGAPFPLTDYGAILYSGWGEEPPEEIKAKIKEQFG
jgi:hypothetical protein